MEILIDSGPEDSQDLNTIFLENSAIGFGAVFTQRKILNSCVLVIF